MRWRRSNADVGHTGLHDRQTLVAELHWLLRGYRQTRRRKRCQTLSRRQKKSRERHRHAGPYCTPCCAGYGSEPSLSSTPAGIKPSAELVAFEEVLRLIKRRCTDAFTEYRAALKWIFHGHYLQHCRLDLLRQNSLHEPHCKYAGGLRTVSGPR
jgi:hypothetical protein